MQSSKAADANEVLAAYQHHIRAGTSDADVFCQLGPILRNFGRQQEAGRCYKRAVELLLAAVRRSDADLALQIEAGVYINFVRPEETEEHYYRCFSGWRDEMARLGRKFRGELRVSDTNPYRIAFVLMTGYRLGHTEVLLRYLSAYNSQRDRRLTLVVYVLEGYSPEFVDLCKKTGTTVVSIVGEHPEIANAGLGSKLQVLRDRMRTDRIGCAVWVSVPTGAAFAFSMGLAPVQIFWALRFHPLAGPYIDGYLTYGAPGEKERIFGKQVWRVVPTPLAIEKPVLDLAQVQAVRARFPQPFLFGTVAREDKIRSPEFLKAVAAILKALPGTGYVWTGRERDKQIDDFFTKQGLAGRCHFAGWVDSALYGAAFDVFLETFPLGCGITGYQALGAGTAMLSYMDENTVFGMQYWPEIKAGIASGTLPDLSGYPLLCARNPEEYVQFAVKLAADSEFREATGKSGQAFFGREVTLGVSQANAFFQAIEEVIAKKMEQAA